MRQRHIKLHILAGSGCANDGPGLKLPVRPLARLRAAELRILSGGTPPDNPALGPGAGQPGNGIDAALRQWTAVGFILAVLTAVGAKWLASALWY